MLADEKRRLYQELLVELGALVTESGDPVAAMAGAVAVIHNKLPYASWTGFYRVVGEGQLRVGPYQGPVGCVDIPFDRGVCGAAARERRTQLVDDVHAFEGHIACDPESRSEIVVPVDGPDGELVAVLDLDSRTAAAFDDVDRAGLEKVAARLAPYLGGSG